MGSTLHYLVYFYFFLPLKTFNYFSSLDFSGLLESLHHVPTLCATFLWTCLPGSLIGSFFFFSHLQHLQPPLHELSSLFTLNVCLLFAASLACFYCNTLLLPNISLVFLPLAPQTPARRWWRSTTTGRWCSARPCASRPSQHSLLAGWIAEPAAATLPVWASWEQCSPATNR